MRLAWLLFMQPLRLQGLFRAWGLGEKDPSLLELRPWTRTRDAFVVTLVRRLGAILFGLTPAVAALVIILATATGIPIDPSSVKIGVGLGLAFGVMYSVAMGVVGGVVGGVAGGVVAGVVSGLLSAASSSLAFDLVACVAAGVTGGVAMGSLVGVVVRSPIGASAGFVSGMIGSLVIGAACGSAYSAVYMGGGSLVGGFAFLAILSRVPALIISSVVCLVFRACTALRPSSAVILSRWLPFRHHELIFYPIPGLEQFLIRLGELNPELAQGILAESAASLGQKGVARRALIELEARDLERTARNRTFARISDLGIDFLPSPETLEPQSPLLLFQRAAKELGASHENHRQRRLAL